MNDHPPPWNTEPLDVPLRIVLSEAGFTIERAEHDGTAWTEGVEPRAWWSYDHYRQVLATPERPYMPGGWYACYAGRLDKTTDVEGALCELPYLIDAVQGWEAESADRWAIVPDGDTALVYSPRNSARSTRVTRRALQAMIAEYEEAP